MLRVRNTIYKGFQGKRPTVAEWKNFARLELMVKREVDDDTPLRCVITSLCHMTTRFCFSGGKCVTGVSVSGQCHDSRKALLD